MNPPPPLLNSPAPLSPAPSRLWPGLALALFVVSMLIAIPIELASSPVAIDRIVRDADSSTWVTFSKVRMWVSFTGQLVFAGGVLLCAGFVRGGWGIRRLSLLAVAFGIGASLLALIVVNLMHNPAQSRLPQSFDIWDWIWLAQVSLQTGAVVALALALRGWIRWAGLAIGVVVFVFLFGDWAIFMARKFGMIEFSAWNRWGSWTLGFAGVLGAHLAVVLCTAMVLFKPALASDGPRLPRAT